ncbi:hypothetical protein ABZ079_30960 [Streptomyces sp. NPDC006314]|uniref:hypothetical protein n=1 Tax=Streptomyces sp. NPDC006314 TaxID=3154475 RepID=UPI0033B9E143
MRRARVMAAGVTGGMLLLSGCTAVDLPLAGVRVGTDGTPYAVFRPCGDDGYQGPHLDGRRRGAGDGPVTTGWDARREGLHGDAGFPLFTPPEGWQARHRGKQELLPRHDYVLGFGHYDSGDSYNGVVEFTADQIGRLKPGQVWADGRTMSRGAFGRLAEDSC